MDGHPVDNEAVAGARAALGRQLAAFRKTMGYAQRAFARKVAYSRSTVANVEIGRQHVARDFWERSDEVLQAYGALISGYDELEEVVREREKRIAQVAKVERKARICLGRDFSASASSAHSALAATGMRDRLAFLSAPFDEVISHLRELWHPLVRADNLFGPAHALGAVHEQIAIIEALLSESDARDGNRAALLQLGAQYAESVAWLHEDGGSLSIAEQWTNRALEWAHAASDRRMVSWVLFRRSQQATNERNAAFVIGLARAAQQDDDWLPEPMRAAAIQQEAQGIALDGDEIACHKKLDEAHRWAAPLDARGDARDGHGAFCSASYIELQRAHCWMTLGRPDRAVPVYEAALADMPVAYQRDRAFGLSKLAGAFIALRRPEEAATAAQEASKVARSGGSMRTFRQVKLVGQALVQHRRLPVVADFLDALTDAST